ncbi:MULTISPECIES: SDR family oxidoreductase [unclassified Rathayibacter]|jgi:NAD(P)-dependent dehydrogenase (short-subunit alcohol dehydrogenase family)|uniref:SDR family oxidoreductase n=1 Tax=unclassified Rathayibacter TaxID=2609250 RepID=UPI000CE93699|nr:MULTISPECIES: SDR family oxidoreductase [unclassified Rathayibacter]PPF18743.1 NAD(P)-dependent oxidoreductase [Rathayibacter sp. AY1A7]PPF35186.1 NAD(P)-dependent oxidoreductase [Rathayibacter sp. AY1A3]PPF55551.1 NAD(P)-dependent oxidoreductase [Rathayibacter sp. AY1C2]PPG28319.1 NAD(P)-dependent oxidoreductase [Rathayibacter sp. AY2B9]PPG64496.1 NAD(P)-dependent oxidoreductase [Rathayibacter sp. AY2B7]
MTPESPEQTPPGTEAELTPKADHGETTYRGTGRLSGKVALITGGDSGIGKAVAIAFAREGADVAISYLDEHDDAEDTAKWVREAGREALLLPGDLQDPAHCRAVVTETVERFGHLEVLVSNAAFQMSRESVTDIPDEEWDRTIATNISAYFHLVKSALPHLKEGASIIATSSVQSDQPSYQLLPYAATKSAILSLTASFAQALGEKGIRANSVAPGPIWTPLIPSTMPEEAVAEFGEQVPLGRPGQPAEVAPAYVLLASDEASYISGSTIAVTGGKPIL